MKKKGMTPDKYNETTSFQFCLEDENNFLENEDWLVHLDEETLLTENSVRGILNFVTANKGCR